MSGSGMRDAIAKRWVYQERTYPKKLPFYYLSNARKSPEKSRFNGSRSKSWASRRSISRWPTVRAMMRFFRVGVWRGRVDDSAPPSLVPGRGFARANAWYRLWNMGGESGSAIAILRSWQPDGHADDTAFQATDSRACSIAPFNRLADAAEIPAKRPASLIPLPSAKNWRAFLTLPSGMAGLPNLTEALRAAA